MSRDFFGFYETKGPLSFQDL